MGEPLEYYNGGAHARRNRYPGMTLRLILIPFIVFILLGLAIGGLQLNSVSDLFHWEHWDHWLGVERLYWLVIFVLTAIWLGSVIVLIRHGYLVRGGRR